MIPIHHGIRLLKLIPEKSRVLDIGCSSGNFGEVVIKRKKAIVDGIELNEKDAEIAGRKLHKVFNIDIEADGVGSLDNDYDVIYFGDVIEHLQHPIDVLKAVKKLLRKDGLVIFSIPNMSHISVRLMLMTGNFEYGNTGLLDKTHLHYYDKAEVERVFSDAGYRIEQLDWVSRDIPRELLKSELDKIGLTGDDNFFKLAKSVGAQAHQYIGRAIPTNAKAGVRPRPNVSPAIDLFERHLADIKQSYIEEVDRLNERNQASQVKTEVLIKQVDELTKQVKGYDNSLSWKITKPLRGVARIINKIGTKT